MVLEDIVIQTTHRKEAEGAQEKSNLLELLKQQYSTHDEIIPYALFMEALQLIKRPAMKYCSNCKRNEIPTKNPEVLRIEANLMDIYEDAETMPAEHRDKLVAEWEASQTSSYAKYKRLKAERARMPRCRLCNAVYYCCAAHERKDWGEHKKVCAAVREVKTKMRNSMEDYLSCKCVLTLPSGRTAIICEDDAKDENEKTTKMEILVADPQVTGKPFVDNIEAYEDDDEVYGFLSVQLWKRCQYIIGKNQIAVPANTATLMLYYPLDQKEWFKYTIVEEKGQAPSKIVGFTKADVVALIGMTYELIYMIEDAMAKEIKCGQYGIWGHGIEDLAIEEISIGDKFVEVAIGS